jgi:hypothetical protein
VAAINRQDRVAASALAEQALAVDAGNADAEDLLTAPGDAGEIRGMCGVRCWRGWRSPGRCPAERAYGLGVENESPFHASVGAVKGVAIARYG